MQAADIFIVFLPFARWFASLRVEITTCPNCRRKSVRGRKNCAYLNYVCMFSCIRLYYALRRSARDFREDEVLCKTVALTVLSYNFTRVLHSLRNEKLDVVSRRLIAPSARDFNSSCAQLFSHLFVVCQEIYRLVCELPRTIPRIRLFDTRVTVHVDWPARTTYRPQNPVDFTPAQLLDLAGESSTHLITLGPRVRERIRV